MTSSGKYVSIWLLMTYSYPKRSLPLQPCDQCVDDRSYYKDIKDSKMVTWSVAKSLYVRRGSNILLTIKSYHEISSTECRPAEWWLGFPMTNVVKSPPKHNLLTLLLLLSATIPPEQTCRPHHIITCSLPSYFNEN